MNVPTKIEGLETLLEYLRQSRGFDFSGYKRTSLMRRIVKRMQMLNLTECGDYIDYLEVHPEEFPLLFNTILINVTSFFRDMKAWQYIDEFILPRIINNKKPGEAIRVWSAGCASGEEAYTISMLLAEHLGIDGFRERVKVYATDLDEEALAKARTAYYTAREIEGVPEAYLEKYFDRNGGGGYVFNKELRRSVIFGRHDLISDAPISRIDLLTCRNILMYFNSETQGKILARLNYALADQGFLFLGKAEMLLTHLNLFSAVDLKNRIFTKAASINLRDRLLGMSQNGADEIGQGVFNPLRLRDASFDAGPVAQVVVDVNGYLTLVNERARTLFGLSLRDIGRPFQDLELSYRPMELRSAMEATYARNTPSTIKDVEMLVSSGESIFLNIQLTPLVNNGNGTIGISLSFMDVTEFKRMQFQLEQSNQELETAMEEVQSTNEELETTNEELQSTNEELETMNEELQSTNEELETMNDEMTQRTGELNQLNAFLESILTSMHGGVVVIDPEFNVRVWNRKSEDLWGLRSDEVKGQNFFSLDIGLPVDQLKRPIRTILNDETDSLDVTIPSRNRRGRDVLCQVTCTRLQDPKNGNLGVILVIEDKEEARSE